MIKLQYLFSLVVLLFIYPLKLVHSQERLIIKGSDTIGAKLMPKLAEAYTNKNPETKREIVLTKSVVTTALFLFSCGYKIVDNKINFKIDEIVSTGDKKISYKLKNKLSLISGEEENNLVKININTNKTKSIKERNVKNQITKHNVKIVSKVELIDLSNMKSKKYTFTKNGDFNVGSKHSDTLNNEKKLVDLLTMSISEQIIEALANYSNDS